MKTDTEQKFFSYDPDDGFEFHSTAEEAEARAEKALDYAKDEAADTGWPDNTTDICWGQVMGRVYEYDRKERPKGRDLTEDEAAEFQGFDTISNHKLEDVK